MPNNNRWYDLSVAVVDFPGFAIVVVVIDFFFYQTIIKVEDLDVTIFLGDINLCDMSLALDDFACAVVDQLWLRGKFRS